MSEEQGLSFYKNRKFLILSIIGLLLTGAAISASQPDVSIGSNGVEINTGGLDMGGGDITDGGTTIYDAASGEIPDAVLGIDLSTNAGDDLTWDGTNNEFDVDSNNIQSGTTASDVGLGNVENEAAVAESGDTMTGNLTMGDYITGDVISPSSNYIKLSDGSSLGSIDTTISADNELNMITDSSGTPKTYTFKNNGDLEGPSNSDFGIVADTGQDLFLFADQTSSCYISADDGSWNCDGTKNWIHSLNSTHDAYYTSQESPEVRAVYEGKVDVDGETRVELPKHFSSTVSDSEPKLRATSTVQGELAYSAVIEKTDDYIVLDSSEPSTVNYRITGIREGYEDKQVVREKQD